MEVSSNSNIPNSYLENSKKAIASTNDSTGKEKNENLVEIMEKSAIEVSLSMNAQIVLFAMDASELNKGNITGQKEIFDFLSGKILADGSSLTDIGYEGKPITELSPEEATELLSEDGFFGIQQTSQRVAQFSLGFSDDPEIIKEILEGVKQGFKEAEELWGGELPEISYKTQERTIELIEARLAELENNSSKEENVEESTQE